MTTDSKVLQRAPKGWKKRRGSDYTWRPSKASDFKLEGPGMHIPAISISDPTYTMEDMFDEKEKTFEEGAVLSISVDNVFFIEKDEDSEGFNLEKKTSDFLDLDKAYEVKIELWNMTEEEVKRKAKELMQRIQDEEDLAEFIQEKEEILYGIDTKDVRTIHVDPHRVFEETDEYIGMTEYLLYLSDDKEAVERYLVDSKIDVLEDEAEDMHENIDRDLERKKEEVKSVDPTLINFD